MAKAKIEVEDVVEGNTGEQEAPVEQEATEAAQQEPVANQEDSGVDWEGLLDEGSDSSEPTDSPKGKEEGAEGAEAAQEEPESSEAQEEEPPKEVAEPAEEERKQPTEPQEGDELAAEAEKAKVPEQPETPQWDPEELRKARDAWEKDMIARYAMSDEAAEELLTDFASKGPEMLGRMHVAIIDQVRDMMGQLVPGMVQQFMQQRDYQNRWEDAFFNRWPDLKGTDRAMLARLVQVHAQSFPEATPEERIEQVGLQAMIHAGKNPLAQAEAQAEAEAETQKPKPKPYRPATPGGQKPPARAPKAPDNPFTEMAEEYLAEE